MSKFLLLILVVAVAWWLAKGYRRKRVDRKAAETASENMVNCGHCGLYLPRSEAVQEGNRFFCCAEHRRLAG